MTTEEMIRNQKKKQKMDRRRYKIIRTAFLDEGYVYADSEEEAIDVAIKEWGITRETIVGAIHVTK